MLAPRVPKQVFLLGWDAVHRGGVRDPLRVPFKIVRCGRVHGLATILLLTVAAVEQNAVPRIVCDTPSEVASGSPVRLQCTLAPELRAVALVLQHRPAGNEVFVPTPGLRMAPGKFVVSICPDSLIPGAMHFFFEARDSEDRVLATSGNLEQPHLLTVRAPGDVEPRCGCPCRCARAGSATTIRWPRPVRSAKPSGCRPPGRCSASRAAS